MNKFIAAMDGLKFSNATKDYAIHLATHAKAFLAGIFLDDFTYTSYKVYDMIVKEGVSGKKLKYFEQKDKDTRDKAAMAFDTACHKPGLQYSIHRDRHVAMQDLLHESIYADLLIIDGKETFTKYEEKQPTRFIRELLTDVQCPVLVVPQKYKSIQKIILLFDGEPSSVHAVKMFHYTLSYLSHLPVEVVSVKKMGTDLHVPDSKLMKEFMKRYYPKATYTVLKGVAETTIINHLKEQKENILIVSGAYRRGAVSRWFKTSMADVLMREIKAPLFVAHNK
jgi:nucleotide-binding universal stress UspA family protein